MLIVIRDWGLRNARKTAFHAAVNYYCRQLGITLYNAPIPLAYADESGEILIAPDASAADEVEPPMPAESPAQEAPGEKKDKTVWLGFQPPPEDGIPSGMRPRKAKSRKAMLRTFGADGF